MKQLLILSGKGGTGKTTVAGAFIRLSGAPAYADCDVDAPNLHLIMARSAEPKRTDYYGLPKAVINPDTCVQCGLCLQNCRFDAISAGTPYEVDAFSCEGCGVCEALCPEGAVSLVPAVAGDLMLYTDRCTAFSTAQLRMGSGTSGKLVTEVKKQLKTAAPHAALAIIDGSPGIGCPVIASMSGVHLALIVAEPSVSGLSDLERVLRTGKILHTRTAVCINKADTNMEKAEEIEAVCRNMGIPFVGRIPFDPAAVKAVNSGLTIADLDCPSGRAVRTVFDETMKILDQYQRETST